MAHRVRLVAHRGVREVASARRATGPLQLFRRLPRPALDGAAEGVAGGEAEAAVHVRDREPLLSNPDLLTQAALKLSAFRSG